MNLQYVIFFVRINFKNYYMPYFIILLIENTSFQNCQWQVLNIPIERLSNFIGIILKSKCKKLYIFIEFVAQINYLI